MERHGPIRLPSRRLTIVVSLFCVSTSIAGTLSGNIVDSEDARTIAARIYIHNAAGEFFHVQSPNGTAVPYRKRRSSSSFEIHTTLSAHPFRAELPKGDYTITVEKGKEYFPARRNVTITDEGATKIQISLDRWTNMADRGWYSGETHVHREVAELPVLQLSEDINVAFPLTAWVTDSEQIPARHNKNKREVPAAKLVRIDKTHVFWPVNTEYEIFTIAGRRHTLGAVFILNHRRQFTLPAPPVSPIAIEARKQNGILELDKHNWPWSMILVPAMKVDLYELANNHMWRSNFLYSDWYPEYAAEYMNIEMVDNQFTERGWIDFGLENYYALLNCGFPMKPTAGTASGVHPVPFGFGRVYVNLDGEFSYEKWIDGLLAGKSFVTTGPMLTSTVERVDAQNILITGQFESPTEPVSLEVLINGRVAKSFDVPSQQTASGSYRMPFTWRQQLDGTSWLAVRAFAKRDTDRVSFAHTAPVHFEVPGQPLRPTRNQRDYIAKRVRDEINRSRHVVSADALREFEAALKTIEAVEID